MAPGKNPGLGAENLGQRKKAHGEHEGQKSGKPELLDAVGHRVFLSSGGLNFTAQIAPIVDLAEAAPGGVSFRESSAAQIHEGFVEMGGEFLDDVGAVVRVEHEGSEMLVDELAPIR